MILRAEKEYIFEPDAVTNACHASTVLPLANGRVLAAWFGGKREKDENVEIYVSKRENGVWSTPECVSENDAVPCWNPVLFRRKNGETVLFYKYGYETTDWSTKYTVSKDGGDTWSAPALLVPGDADGGRGPVKNKCLRTTKGLLIAPASTELDDLWLPFMDLSEDDGTTWIKTPLMERPKYKGTKVRLIQPTLWEDADGEVHCLLRSNKGALYRSDSANGGYTWTKPHRTRLPNNNSGVDCCTDTFGRLWLVYNPVKVNWGLRYPLVLACSKDNGRHFQHILTLEAGPGEYSYPAVVYCNGALHITYTHKRKQIVYWKITLEE